MRTIVEDFNYAMQETSSKASQQAKQLGLMYVGFGRYEDPTTKQVTHIVQNDVLVPYRKAIKTNTYKSQNSDDYGNLAGALSPEAKELNNILIQTYGPEAYDEKELAAIGDFVNSSYSDINDLLTKFPAGTPITKIMPDGPEDTRTDIISALDSAMKKSRTPVEFIAYTKLDKSVQRMDIIPGTAFKFKGFRNTTISLGAILADTEEESAVLQIKVKKNARGIYTANYSETPDDGEFILPRGAKIEVLGGPNRLVGSDGQAGGSNKEIYYYDCVTKS